MAESKAQKSYDIQVGTRLYEGLSSGVVLKNIQSGKLKAEDQIRVSGSGSWVKLADVPELKRYFREEAAPEVPLVTITTYEIWRSGGEPQGNFSRARIIDMIRKNELAEVDQIRKTGNDEWLMAGDLGDFTRFFDMRRQQSASFGAGATYRDTGKPFYTDLIAPFRYLGNRKFFFNLLTVMICYGIAAIVQIPIIAGPINVLTSLYIYSYFFRVISTTANGGVKFPEMADFSDFSSELIRPSIQFFLTTLVATLPILLYLGMVLLKDYGFFTTMPYYQAALTTPWLALIMPYPAGAEDIMKHYLEQKPELTEQGGIFSGVDPTVLDTNTMVPTGFVFHFWDIFLWLGLIFFLLYLPMSLMRQASYGNFMPTMNLPAVVVSIGRAFGPYLALVAFMLVVDVLGLIIIFAFALAFGSSLVMGSLTAGFDPTNPIASALVGAIFMVIVQGVVISATFLKMFFIGRFLFQYEKKMGWS